MQLADYQNSSVFAKVDRDSDGVLTVCLHTDDDSLVWGLPPHRELTDLFEAVAGDRENRAVIITGAGEYFIRRPDVAPGDFKAATIDARGWDVLVDEGLRLVDSLLAIQAPTIAAMNGPATLHSEIAVFCDIVLCTPDTFFQDAGHYAANIVPGDSMQLVWPLLLGINRGRYFLLTGQKLYAAEAHERGVVGEVVEPGQLLERAHELAIDLTRRDPMVNRNTRHAILKPLRRAMNEDLHTGLLLEALAALAVRAG